MVSVTNRTWLALAINAALAIPFVLASYFHWTGAVVGAFTVPIFLTVLLRAGTLAAVAMFATFYMVNFGLVGNPSDWRFATTLVPGLLLLSVAGYGLATATGAVGGTRQSRPHEVSRSATTG